MSIYLLNFVMSIVSLAAGTEPQLSNTAEPEAMPNIGYLFRGYDLMYGNPLPTDGFFDPGFRQPVFTAVYTPGSLTPDQQYKQPDGTFIASCSGTCSLNFVSKEIAGTHSYQDSLEEKTSVSAGGWGSKFSASTDYKRVQKDFSSHDYVDTHSDATCCAYEATIETFLQPSLHPGFEAGLKAMPTTYDFTKYKKFIDTFGTHYVSKLTMGALFGQESSFKNTSWTKMLDQNINIKVAASYSAFGISASASHQHDDQKKMADTFRSYSAELHVYSVGAKPPADGTAATWAQSTLTSPAPMRTQLESLVTLVSDTRIKANLQTALDEYCGHLKKAGIVKTCDAPGKDPPFPQPSKPAVSWAKASNGFCSEFESKQLGTHSSMATCQMSCASNPKCKACFRGCPKHCSSCIYVSMPECNYVHSTCKHDYIMSKKLAVPEKLEVLV